MRLYFPNLNRPRKAAKTVSNVTGKPLHLCQEAVAKACGYRDWHELSNSLVNQSCIVNNHIVSQDLLGSQFVLSSRLIEELKINSGDGQYAVARSQLVGNGVLSPSEQVELRVRLFQKFELPPVPRREKGAVGVVKGLPRRKREVVILRAFGRNARVITDYTPDAACRNCEYITPKRPVKMFVPKRLYLPYGAWTELDGATVIFSRDYCPMWRLREGRTPERMFPWEWVKFVEQSWFWNEGDEPWFDERQYAREMRRLSDFGVVGLPILAEVLPIILEKEEIGSFKEAVKVMEHYSFQPA